MTSDLIRLMLDALLKAGQASGEIQRAATKAQVQATSKAKSSRAKKGVPEFLQSLLGDEPPPLPQSRGFKPDVLVDDNLVNAKDITAALKGSTQAIQQATATVQTAQPTGGEQGRSTAETAVKGAVFGGTAGVAAALAGRAIDKVAGGWSRSMQMAVNDLNPVNFLPQGLQATKSGQAFGSAFATAGQMATDPFELLDMSNWAQLQKDVWSGFIHLPQSISDFNEGLLAGARELSKWNGTIATNMARLDVQQIKLDVARAQATAGSNTLLTDSQMQLREALQPLKIMGDNTRNVVGAIGTQVALMLLRVANIEKMMELGIRVIETIPKFGPEVRMLREAMEALARTEKQTDNMRMRTWLQSFSNGRVEDGPGGKPPRKPGQNGVF